MSIWSGRIVGMGNYRPRSDLPLRLVILGRKMEGHLHECHAKLGLRRLEAEAIRELREYEEGRWSPLPMGKTDLASRLGVKRPDVSKVVAAIGPCGRGLITEESQSDRRRQALALTEEGRQLADAYIAAITDLTRGLPVRLGKAGVRALEALESALPDVEVRRHRVARPRSTIKKARAARR